MFGFPFPLYVYDVPFFPLEEVWVAFTTATKSTRHDTNAMVSSPSQRPSHTANSKPYTEQNNKTSKDTR